MKASALHYPFLAITLLAILLPGIFFGLELMEVATSLAEGDSLSRHSTEEKVVVLGMLLYELALVVQLVFVLRQYAPGPIVYPLRWPMRISMVITGLWLCFALMLTMVDFVDAWITLTLASCCGLQMGYYLYRLLYK